MKRFILAGIALLIAGVCLEATPAIAARPSRPVSPFGTVFLVITGHGRQLCQVTATDRAGQIVEITCRAAVR